MGDTVGGLEREKSPARMLERRVFGFTRGCWGGEGVLSLFRFFRGEFFAFSGSPGWGERVIGSFIQRGSQ